MACHTPGEAIAKFRGILNDIEIQYPVSANRTSEISILVSSVNPVRLKNNPVGLDTSAIHKLYETIVL